MMSSSPLRRLSLNDPPWSNLWWRVSDCFGFRCLFEAGGVTSRCGDRVVKLSCHVESPGSWIIEQNDHLYVIRRYQPCHLSRTPFFHLQAFKRPHHNRLTWSAICELLVFTGNLFYQQIERWQIPFPDLPRSWWPRGPAHPSPQRLFLRSYQNPRVLRPPQERPSPHWWCQRRRWL